MTLENFTNIVEVFIAPLVLYFAREMSLFKDKVSTLSGQLSELRTVLVGIDGKNGIRSRVIRIEKNLHSEHTEDED